MSCKGTFSLFSFFVYFSFSSFHFISFFCLHHSHQAPFVPRRSLKPLTDVDTNFYLHSDARAVEREKVKLMFETFPKHHRLTLFFF